MNASGAVTLGWTKPWFGGGAPGNSVVTVVQRLPGGSWSAPEPISPTGLSNSNYVDILMTDAGDTYGYWIQPNGSGGTVIGTNHKPLGAAWDGSFGLVGLSNVQAIDLGISASGETAGIVADFPGTPKLYGIVRQPGALTYTYTELSSANTVQGLAAVNGAGDAVAAWRDSSDDGIHPASRPAGGSWSAQPPRTANPALGAGTPQVAIDRAGGAIVTWDQFPPAGTNPHIWVSEKPAGSSAWSSPTDLTSGMNQYGNVPVIAENAVGDVVIAFLHQTVLQVVARRAGGSFSAPIDIAMANTNPAVAIDSHGNFIVAWETGSTPAVSKATARSVDTPQLGTNVTISPPDTSNWRHPQPAASTSDGVVMLTTTPQVTPSIVRAVGWDASGPTFTGVDFPSTATAGAPFNYSATATDIWSPIATDWAFGDGTSATGDSGSKAYAAEGSHTATVTATDAVGNATQSSRAIAVGPAPPTGGPTGGGGAIADTTAPVFSSASLKPKAFAVDPKSKAETPVAAAVKRGTTFRYALSEAARVVFTIQRELPGRKVGRRCVKPTAKNRKKKPCTRYQRAGRFALPSAQGPNRHKFSGRVGRRSLRPGHYRAVLVATDAAGNQSAPRRLRFTVVRAPRRR